MNYKKTKKTDVEITNEPMVSNTPVKMKKNKVSAYLKISP